MKTNDFLCGVIEGYYGRPWSFNQRKTLFEQFGFFNENLRENSFFVFLVV